MMGDPKVMNDAYIKKRRMLEVERLSFSPSFVQTPNA
jgi:hypothetical protein